ncbi:O-antigen/teichoic acid export membrane protein [Nitrosospira multiformis]|uniref:O-antigen/teichoic acid export membrane protein n=1 Tax=Nitrosospira multiformis TaxID=1231 RepID=A0A2T5IB22_9PROT|nr:oligosaccharide flippase family protein [Nitrosospira multiformis]PTQ81032.1 O-antigen/teichoic acid export membrane protein [Nitrosospira multiformis]
MSAKAAITPQKDLAVQSFKAFFWGAGGSILKIVLQFVTQVILARLLGPAEYGIFSLGVIVVGLTAIFYDVGLAYSLIQKKSISADDIRFVWTWQCILGLSVATSIFFASDLIANFFSKPKAEFLFQSLSLVILINSLTALSFNLLKKSLNYKVIQISQLISYFLGFACVGIPLAFAGYGHNALAVAWLIQAAMHFTILYTKVRHPVSLRLQTQDGNHMLRYSLTAFGTNLVNWILNGVDKIWVGKIYSAYIVGLYTTAYNLVNTPAFTIFVNLQAVFFSAGARLQEDHEALRTIFLRLLSLITLTAFPFFIVIGWGSDFIIETVYGVKWAEASPFLVPFAFATPFLLLWGISTPVLWNSGHTKLELRLQLPLVFLWLAVLYFITDLPPLTLAIAAASLFAFRSIAMAAAALYVLKIPISSFLRAIAAGVVLSLLLGVVSAAVKPIIAGLDIDVGLQLLLLLGAASVSYLLSLYFLVPRLLAQDLRAYLMREGERLPGWARSASRFLLRHPKP